MSSECSQLLMCHNMTWNKLILMVPSCDYVLFGYTWLQRLMIILWYHIMRKCVHKILSYVQAHCLWHSFIPMCLYVRIYNYGYFTFL
jgi:hypothetical protein